MDPQKAAEARQMLRDMAMELERAASAAREAVIASTEQNNTEAWKQLQQLYTRFDSATQLLKDMRRTVDAALER